MGAFAGIYHSLAVYHRNGLGRTVFCHSALLTATADLRIEGEFLAAFDTHIV
jgi:hypothetical protein